MSVIYEGVVFRSDELAARAAFEAVVSPLQLRLVRLADGVFGVYRVAGRYQAFDWPALEFVAKQLSAHVGRVIALLYDNRCGSGLSVLYMHGQHYRAFGDGDTWWVPYGENGELLLDGPRYRESELRSDEEYDCIYSAIDAGLEAAEASPAVDAALVKQAFSYEALGWLAERKAEQSAPANRPSE